jgi:hypothetical protein
MPPAGLRPYLGFTRLSTTVLQAVARVVDNDAEFRARVAAAVDEEAVGRAGWLWLTRPDGYHEDLRKLEDDADAVAAAEAEDREERDARRRLAAAQAAADRAAATIRAQGLELDDLRAQLLGERSRLVDVEARLAEVDDELDRVRAERARAVRQLKDLEARLADRIGEVKRLKARLREVEDVEAPPAPDPAPVGRPRWRRRPWRAGCPRPPTNRWPRRRTARGPWPAPSRRRRRWGRRPSIRRR